MGATLPGFPLQRGQCPVTPVGIHGARGKQRLGPGAVAPKPDAPALGQQVQHQADRLPGRGILQPVCLHHQPQVIGGLCEGADHKPEQGRQQDLPQAPDHDLGVSARVRHSVRRSSAVIITAASSAAASGLRACVAEASSPEVKN